MIKTLSPKYVASLLFIIIFGLYYASLLEVFFKQSVISIDDRTLVQHLENHKLQFAEVIKPGWQKKYYRPLVDLSYLIDQRLWGESPFTFRLTNVLIHSFNTLLLYLTSRRFFKYIKVRPEVPFIAALLFGLHPVAVESVSWISGRTDPLATFWSLLAILFYLKGRTEKRSYLILLSFLFTLAALLSKEVALATPIVIAAWELFYCSSFGYKRSRFASLLISLSVFAIPVYLALRSVAMVEDYGLSMIFTGLEGGAILNALELFLASFGFYLKKFIFPFPLNFTILQINTSFYAIIGAFSIIGLIAAFFKRRWRPYHLFFFWAMLGLGPAALISFTDISWTSWAERYLYFSMAPLSIFVVMLFSSLFNSLEPGYRRALLVFSIIPLLIFAVSTWQRSAMMNDNEAVWRDSYKKSPPTAQISAGYANALAQAGKLEEAEGIVKEALRLSDGAKHSLFLNMGHLSRIKGDYEAAENYYRSALGEARADEKLVSVGRSFRTDILLSIADLKIQQGRTSKNEIESRDFFLGGIDSLKEAYEKEIADSFLLYRIAKLYLAIGEKAEAAEYLRKFIRIRGDDYYREAAEKILRKNAASLDE